MTMGPYLHPRAAPSETEFLIRVESESGRVFLSEERFPSRELARERIREHRREGGWSGCKFWTVPA